MKIMKILAMIYSMKKFLWHKVFSKAEQLLFLYVATYNNKVTWTDGQCIVHILFSNTTFLFYYYFFPICFLCCSFATKIKKKLPIKYIFYWKKGQIEQCGLYGLWPSDHPSAALFVVALKIFFNIL